MADGKHTSVVGIEIEWVVKNERREHSKASTSAYTCGSNTDFTHSNNVQGYLACTDKHPYLQQGCQDKLVNDFWNFRS
jgi:hypothetical protein